MPYSFEDDFTDTAGTAITSHTGWSGATLVRGENGWQIDGSGASLAKAATTTAQNALSYGTFDGQRFGFDLTTGFNHGVYFHGSGTGTGFNAYVLVGNGANAVRLRRVESGVEGTLLESSITTVGKNDLEVATVVDAGVSVTIYVYQGGSLLHTEVDSAAGRFEGTGDIGLWSNASGALSTVIDNWKAGYSAGGGGSVCNLLLLGAG